MLNDPEKKGYTVLDTCFVKFKGMKLYELRDLYASLIVKFLYKLPKKIIKLNRKTGNPFV